MESGIKNQEARTPAQWNKTPLAGVSRVIAIASGKGGVGKSTTTVMLAHAMAAMGQRVGILDADIYGPSIPRMLGLSGKPEIKNDKMVPLISHQSSVTRHPIACNSMGFLLEESQAAIWRGPMITKALHQLARLTDWAPSHSPLATLLVDMPPGTGDIHLSMVQQVPLSGAILVTTPQDVAVQDALKCADMFRKVNIPILGVIENMSWLETPAGEKMEIFGSGGGAKLAAACGAPLLAKIPLMPALVDLLDNGKAPTPEMLGYFPMI
jgi:ATP-binding protein involved in chromosome partitioning